jgi:hypothetical protein
MKSELKITGGIFILLGIQALLIRLEFEDVVFPMSVFGAQISYYIFKECDYKFFLFAVIIAFIFCILFFYQRANLLHGGTAWSDIIDQVAICSAGLILSASLFMATTAIYSRRKKEKIVSGNQ